MDLAINRYSRQIALKNIGSEGQRKLAASSVLIAGCGALGTAAASILVRAGVGKVRIVDRDFIETHNLQRQVLFDESDVRDKLPKAKAAERHLKQVNSHIDVEGIVADINYSNIESLMEGTDVIVDGLDNLETRYLINDAAIKHGIPWVYGAALATDGMVMPVVPGQTPCLRCVFPHLPGPGSVLTCETAGILGALTMTVASLQTIEVMKLLTGTLTELNRHLMVIDVWQGSFRSLKIERSESCPSCHGQFEFLEAESATTAVSLCGQNAVQVLSPVRGRISFHEMAIRLSQLGEVSHNAFTLRFRVDGHEIALFPDGRAIIKGTDDLVLARSLYAKYIGQ